MSKEMRTLLMGMSGQFSHIVLERLLAHSFDVVAILVAGPRNVPLRVRHSCWRQYLAALEARA